MITKIIFIFSLIILQNIFLMNPVYAAKKYIEVDSIVAVAGSNSITRLELKEKKGKIKESFIQKKEALPNDKEITKLALDQLITEKLVIEYAALQGINVSNEQLNNVVNNIAVSNNLTTKKLIEEIESSGTSFSDFREDIRIQLIFDQVKKKLISANLKISEFEINNFIELQKERTPTKYDFSHIFIKFINDNGNDNDIKKTNVKLSKVIEKLKINNFSEIAINYSDGPMAQKGGTFGSLTADEIPEIFVEPIKLMEVGAISEAIIGSNGYHIIKLNEKKEFEIEKIVVKQSKVKQILLKQNQIISDDEIKRKLENIRNMIIEGMEFSEAAEKYSEDGSAANKGDLGWLNPGDTIPAFENEMDNLDLNEISQPVKTALGWHLIQVNDRREKDLSSESLREKVKKILLTQKTNIKFNDWIKSIREGAHVETWLYEN
jgi:peptidyl-prolyl cis-trans isomerase SurA